MVHRWSAVLSAAFAALFVIGLWTDVHSSLVWLVGAAAAFTLGDAIIDRDVVSRASRATGLVLLGLSLYAVVLLGWHANVTASYLWSTAGLGCASVVVGAVGLLRDHGPSET